MSKFSDSLWDEVAKHTRREIRQATDPLKKQLADQKAAIQALQAQLDDMDKSLAALTKAVGSHIARKANSNKQRAQSHPFSPAQLAALRKAYGLSQDQFGKKLRVSGQTIYNWEGGRGHPKPDRYKAIEALMDRVGMSTAE